MSVEAISRALNLAPVPADRSGQSSSACKFVLSARCGPARPSASASSRAVSWATAVAIPGARLVIYPELGHDLPRELWPSMLDEIAALAAQAPARPRSPRPATTP